MTGGDGRRRLRNTEAMSADSLRRTAFYLTITVGSLCVIGVLAAVVATARDGRRTDDLALLAVGAFVIAWRLRPGVERDRATSHR